MRKKIVGMQLLTELERENGLRGRKAKVLKQEVLGMSVKDIVDGTLLGHPSKKSQFAAAAYREEERQKRIGAMEGQGEYWDGVMLDITGPKVVEVQFSADWDKVWVNVDGECRFRACRIKNLSLESSSVTTTRKEDGKWQSSKPRLTRRKSERT